jgi:hypothetical protein
MRRVLWFVLLLAVGCSAPPPDREEMLRTMKAQAEEVRQALLAGDPVKMIDRTHPKVIRMLGGREAAIERLRGEMEALKGKKGKIKSMTFEGTPDLASSQDEWYGVLPTLTEMEIGGAQAGGKSFLLGISEDGGRTWTFADGTEAASPAFRKLFPNIPPVLKFPETRTFFLPDKR